MSQTEKEGELEKLIKQDLDHLIHAWSSINEYKEKVFADRGKGCYYWDANGKKYLDTSAQMWYMNVGHSHQKVVKAIIDQVKKLQSHYHYFGGTAPRAKLAKLLADITPSGLNRSYLTLGGAEATDIAMRIAKQVKNRNKIVSFWRSYHGVTGEAIGALGDPMTRNAWGPIIGHVKVHYPYCYRCPFGLEYPGCDLRCAEIFETSLLFEGVESIAAVIGEPIIGSGGGVIIPPPEWWPKIRKICKKYDILLIADEIITGFGRTGKVFGIDNWSITPDMMTLAKGLTSGYIPLGATIVSDEIADYYKEQMLMAGLTYSGHTLGCAAAVANINAILEDKLVDNAAKIGEYMKKGLNELREKHPSVGDVRSIGLMACLELVKNRETKEPLTPMGGGAPIPIADMMKYTKELEKKKEKPIMNKIQDFAFENGMILNTSEEGRINLSPPLIISKEEIDEIIEILDKTLKISDKEAT